MTNSKTITPFCCDMSNASEQEIRDLHKMCLDAGASDYENSSSWFNNRSWYNYMGIDDDGEIIALDGTTDYQDNIIPLEEVPPHLGLTLPEVDKTLVEGAIQEAYIDLRGYLGNVVSASNGYRVGTGILFKSPYKDLTSGLTSQEEDVICTVKEFQEYCEQHTRVSTQTSLNQPVRGSTTEPKQSHPEELKPLRWTPDCLVQGIPFQVGMQVSIDSANVQGDFNVVTAIGEEFVLLKVDNTERCVRKEEVLPYRKVVVSQRDKVMAYLEQEFDEEDSSIIYNEILKLGVFKEDGEYAEQ